MSAHGSRQDSRTPGARQAVIVVLASAAFLSCNRGTHASGTPTLPAHTPTAIAPTPHLAVGVAQGNRAQEFTRVVTPFLLPDGELVVPDAGADVIRVFGPHGKLVRSLGRKGKGPGEFAWLGAAWPAGDTIEAFDSELGRITRFLPDGSARIVRLDMVESAQVAVPTRLPDGWIIAGVASAGMGRRDDVVVHRFNRNGAHIGIIARVKGMARFRTPAVSGPGPLSPRAVFAVRDDLVYVGQTLTPGIRVLSPTGALVREIRWTPATTTSPRAALAAVVRTAMAGVGRDRAADTRKALMAFPLPDRLSVFWSVLVDADGFVWVQRYDPRRDSVQLTGNVSGPGGTWRIFAPDGTLAGTVRMPDGFQPTQIGDSAVVGIRRDSLGVESVEVHTLTRVGG